MRTLLIASLVLWASAAQAQSWSRADDPGELVGQLHFDSGVRDCDGRVQEIPAYAFPTAVTITDVWIWQGSDAPLPGQSFVAVDLYAVLYASRPHGYKLLQAPEDRYAPPSSQVMHHRAILRSLLAGDTIGGGFFCNALFGRTSHTHLGVTVEYRKESLVGRAVRPILPQREMTPGGATQPLVGGWRDAAGRSVRTHAGNRTGRATGVRW